MLTTQTDVSTVTKLYVSRMFRTIWPTLHRVSCSNQSSKSESRRRARTVSFQLPSGKTSNHHSSDSDLSDTLEEKKEHLVLQVYSRQHNLGETKGARACLFLLLFFLRRVILIVWERDVVFCWLSCAESSFKCLCASSWRSAIVLKKSASVLAKGSPPSWSPFPRVSRARQLHGVVADGLGRGRLLALLLVEAPRLFLFFRMRGQGLAS